MLWKHQDAKLLASGQILECLSEDLGHGKKQNRTRLNLYCSTLKLDLYQEDIEFVPYPYETKVSLRGVHFLEISSLLLGTPTRHFAPVQLDVIGDNLVLVDTFHFHHLANAGTKLCPIQCPSSRQQHLGKKHENNYRTTSYWGQQLMK